MEEKTLNFLIVEDGVVVNRVVGSTSYMGDNIFEEPEGPTVVIGSVFNESRNLYFPPNITEQELDSKLLEDLPKLQEKQSFYSHLVTTNNFNENITVELKTQTINYLESINKLVNDIEKNPLWICTHRADVILFSEPFKIRPNLNNEV